MRFLFVLFISLFMASPALAGGHGECCKPKPKVVYKTQWKTKVVEKKVPVEVRVPVPVRVPVVVKEKDPCCDKGSVTQTVNVNTGETKVRERVIERVRIKRKRVIREVKVTDPNRLQVLIGASRTGLELEKSGCCTTHVDQKHEFDVGLQYLRDFGVFTGSIGGTLNQSVYLGLGINW